MHGGVLSRWGAGVCVFRGGLFKLGMSLSKENQPQSTQRAQSGAAFLCVLCVLCGFSFFEARNEDFPRRSTRMTRIRRISTDTKSARIRVIA